MGILLINDKFIINISNSWKNIEILYSGWTVRHTDDNINHEGININTGLYVFGAKTNIENIIIHDVAQFCYWSGVLNGTIKNCIIYFYFFNSLFLNLR